jgi:hypothetical protein
MQNDTTDTEPTTAARAPRQRRRQGSSPAQYAGARGKFEVRAQEWLLARPGRTMSMPSDLREVTGLGVPCPGCGALIYRDRDAGHRVGWRSDTTGHWAAGITVTCPT